MDLVVQAILEALRLILSADPGLLQVVVLSLVVSVAATVMAAATASRRAPSWP
jgi:ABC-type tungstate transport system substrate-binding protein